MSEDIAKRCGIRIPEEVALTPDGLEDHRAGHLAAIRDVDAGGRRRMRT